MFLSSIKPACTLIYIRKKTEWTFRIPRCCLYFSTVFRRFDGSRVKRFFQWRGGIYAQYGSPSITSFQNISTMDKINQFCQFTIKWIYSKKDIQNSLIIDRYGLPIRQVYFSPMVQLEFWKKHLVHNPVSFEL